MPARDPEVLGMVERRRNETSRGVARLALREPRMPYGMTTGTDGGSTYEPATGVALCTAQASVSAVDREECRMVETRNRIPIAIGFVATLATGEPTVRGTVAVDALPIRNPGLPDDLVAVKAGESFVTAREREMFDRQRTEEYPRHDTVTRAA